MMLLYLFLLLQLLALAEFFAKDIYVLKIILRFFLFILLVAVVGLRHESGADWTAYLKYFEEPRNNWEVGYSILNNVLPSLYYVNFAVALISLSLLFIAMYYHRVCNYSLFLACSYLPFVILFTGLTRQSVAVTAYVFFSCFLYKRQTVHKISLIIGSLFHFSIIAPAALILFPKVKTAMKLLLLFILFATLMIYWDVLHDKVSEYLINKEYHSVGVCLRISFLILPLFFFIQKKNYLVFTGLLLFVFFAPFFSTIVDRFSYYLIFSTLPLLFSEAVRYRFVYLSVANILSFLAFVCWYAFSPTAADCWYNYSLLLL